MKKQQQYRICMGAHFLCWGNFSVLSNDEMSPMQFYTRSLPSRTCCHCMPQNSTHNSSLIIHRSSFPIHNSAFIIHNSALPTHNPSLKAHCNTPTTVTPTPAWSEPPIEDDITAAEESAEVSVLVNRLPWFMREVTYLHYYKSLSIHQIAVLVKRPAPIVKTWLTHAIYWLRQFLVPVSNRETNHPHKITPTQRPVRPATQNKIFALKFKPPE
jgi:hypothetical protein